MDIGILVSFAGIVVAALAGVLGVWMERDRGAPARWAWVFSGFIFVAMTIEMVHSIAAEADEGQTNEAMARVLEQLSDLAASGDNPALAQFVGAELAAQARNNPKVMKRLERKIAAKGGDPQSIRRRAAEGRRSAAGLPARAPGKAGKAGGATREGKTAGEGRAPGGEHEGLGMLEAGEEGGKAKAKAPAAAVPGPGLPGAVEGKAPGAVREGKAGLPVPVPILPAAGKTGKSGEGKAGKNP